MRVSSDQSVMVRSTFFLSLLVSSILLGGTSGCAPSSRSSGQDSPASASQDLPPLAKEIIDERIVQPPFITPIGTQGFLSTMCRF